MQEKNYKNFGNKFYFLDSKTHKASYMLNFIKKENLAGVVFRKNHNLKQLQINAILQACKAKKIGVFSHYFNNLPCHVLHFGRDVLGPRALKIATEARRRQRAIGTGRGSAFMGSAFIDGLSPVSCVACKFDDLKLLHKMKPKYVFISPVFKTKTHPEATPIGIIGTVKLAKNIKTKLPNSRIILLGGITQRRFANIKEKDTQNLFFGFAGIRF